MMRQEIIQALKRRGDSEELDVVTNLPDDAIEDYAAKFWAAPRMLFTEKDFEKK